jgi:hypothetical protein
MQNDFPVRLPPHTMMEEYGLMVLGSNGLSSYSTSTENLGCLTNLAGLALLLLFLSAFRETIPWLPVVLLRGSIRRSMRGHAVLICRPHGHFFLNDVEDDISIARDALFQM